MSHPFDLNSSELPSAVCGVLQVVRDNLYDAFYKLTDSRSQITSYVFDVVRSTVPKIYLDDVFTVGHLSLPLPQSSRTIPFRKVLGWQMVPGPSLYALAVTHLGHG